MNSAQSKTAAETAHLDGLPDSYQSPEGPLAGPPDYGDLFRGYEAATRRIAKLESQAGSLAQRLRALASALLGDIDRTHGAAYPHMERTTQISDAVDSLVDGQSRRGSGQVPLEPNDQPVSPLVRGRLLQPLDGTSQMELLLRHGNEMAVMSRAQAERMSTMRGNHRRRSPWWKPWHHHRRR